MKKVLFLIFMFLFGLNVIDASNKIYSIDIDVYIDEYGTSEIQEVWTVDGSDGTEWYKVLNNLGNSELSNFSVLMDGKLLKYKDKWNVNGTLNSKKGYYGINDGVSFKELCFGKYDYEKHVFTLNYTLSNFVFNVSDAQVIYFNFIDKLSSVDFDDFSLEISTYYKLPDNIDVWGYGYKGYAYVEDGKIKMSNKKDMDGNYVVLLAKFPLDTFDTVNNYSKFQTFDDVYNLAQEGAKKPISKFLIIEMMIVIFFTVVTLFILFMKYTYIKFYSLILKIFNLLKYKLTIFLMILFLIIGGEIGIFFFSIFSFFLLMIYLVDGTAIYENGKRIRKKDTPYFRDIPCDDLFYANSLIRLNNLGYNKVNIIGALFLKWIKDGIATIEHGDKNEIKLKVESGHSFENVLETAFYDIVCLASKDGVLETKELKKWAKKNASRYSSFFENIEPDGNRFLINNKYMKIDYRMLRASRYVLSDKVYEDSKKLYGLKLFLNDFSNIKDKDVIDVNLMKDYLVYAYLFGISKKVMKKFYKFYPNVVQELSNLNIDMDTLSCISSVSISSSMISEKVSPKTSGGGSSSYSSGGGGSSSSSGGSGSFGGGGGGSR